MKTKIILIISAALVMAVSCGQRNAGKNAAAEETALSQEEQAAVAPEEQYAPKIAAGTQIEDFTVRTATGEDFTFSSLAGSYAILDFWASWCPDCRREIPAVKALYEEFSPKGVKFVSFSVDNDADAWQKALAEEDMAWLQISNLIKWKENPVAEQFGMNWIPTMFLISPDGKVVDFALTAAAMRTKLQGIL